MKERKLVQGCDAKERNWHDLSLIYFVWERKSKRKGGREGGKEGRKERKKESWCRVSRSKTSNFAAARNWQVFCKCCGREEGSWGRAQRFPNNTQSILGSFWKPPNPPKASEGQNRKPPRGPPQAIRYHQKLLKAQRSTTKKGNRIPLQQMKVYPLHKSQRAKLDFWKSRKLTTPDSSKTTLVPFR